jgi:uncharacterized SAM-binding protein YcdF (DUF218 family)
MRIRLKHFAFIFLILFALALFFYSPRYLILTTPPVKSDVVILLLGSINKERAEEAYRLINEGYAGNLFVPAQKRNFDTSDNGNLSHYIKKLSKQNWLSPKREIKLNYQFRENTHLEIIAAKSMMDSSNFTSAIFVSSPYHLRRIKIIADKVFTGRDYQLSFVPSYPLEKDEPLWWVSKNAVAMVVSEYLKIAWFLIYAPFCE